MAGGLGGDLHVVVSLGHREKQHIGRELPLKEDLRVGRIS